MYSCTHCFVAKVHVKLFSVLFCYGNLLFSAIGNYCYGKLKSVVLTLGITVYYVIAFTTQTCLNLNLPPSQGGINIFLDENFLVVAAGWLFTEAVVKRKITLSQIHYLKILIEI